MSNIVGFGMLLQLIVTGLVIALWTNKWATPKDAKKFMAITLITSVSISVALTVLLKGWFV